MRGKDIVEALRAPRRGLSSEQAVERLAEQMAKVESALLRLAINLQYPLARNIVEDILNDISEEAIRKAEQAEQEV